MPIPVQPKKKNRFLIKFKDKFKDILRFTSRSINRPILLNGKWCDIKISLMDPIMEKQNSKIIMGILKKEDRLDKIELLFDIEILDTEGNIVEIWKISSIIKEINFGYLTMEDDNVSDIEIIVKPLNINLQ